MPANDPAGGRGADPRWMRGDRGQRAPFAAAATAAWHQRVPSRVGGRAFGGGQHRAGGPAAALAQAEAELRALAARARRPARRARRGHENEHTISLDAPRYATASTFKALLAAAVLARVEAGKLTLEQRIPISRADLQEHAPVIKARLGEKALPVRDLCAAIVEVSDNGAANVLLRQVDGPAGLTAFLRGIGDTVTRSTASSRS